MLKVPLYVAKWQLQAGQACWYTLKWLMHQGRQQMHQVKRMKSLQKVLLLSGNQLSFTQ